MTVDGNTGCYVPPEDRIRVHTLPFARVYPSVSPEFFLAFARKAGLGFLAL